jgi:hypothetical protein
MFKQGDLVRVVKAKDQNQYMMKYIYDRLGVVVEKVESKSSNNIWRVLVDGNYYELHKLDFVKIEETK